MSETVMSWEAARRLLKRDPEAVVSSLSWAQPGKCIFRAKAFVVVPAAAITKEEPVGAMPISEQESIPALWFRDQAGRVGPYAGSAFGDERDDWVVGPSVGDS
jgi:hypothetical protein